jgi:hypothetical protein
MFSACCANEERASVAPRLQGAISMGYAHTPRAVPNGRARAIHARPHGDARLCVRQGAPWFADLRAELLSFPAGRHDDQVDALGLVGQLLDKINAGQKPKPPDLTQRDACRPAFEEIPGDNWKTL